jgi:NDP-sugar pyrophosphorylase family protein
MRALILSAGLGTRLRPLTDFRAKPAIPVAGVPMIRRIAAWLAGHGVADLVINLHHLPETLTAVVGDGSDLDVRVRYSWEQPQVLGSAGGPRQALPILDPGGAAFLIVNGDTLTDVDVSALAAAHAASGALVTLALVPNREYHRYGGVLVDDSGAVTGFTTRGPAAEGSWHFIGVQAVQPSVFEPLPPGVPLKTIGGVYDDLIRTRPGSVRAFCSDAAFWDVGTAADYLRTASAFAAGGAAVAHSVRIDPTAKLLGSVLWDDVDVGAGAVLEACIVTDGVSVPAGAAYRQSVLTRGDDGAIVAAPIEM